MTGLFGAWFLLLWPDSVWSGAVWQPFTYVFIELGAFPLLFDAAALVTIGGELERWWGPRLLVRFLVGATVVAGLATSVLALAIPPMRYMAFQGGGAMASAAWCAYGWSLGSSLTNFWGITLTGSQLALIGVGFVIMKAAFSSLLFVVPDLIVLGLTYAFVRSRRR